MPRPSIHGVRTHVILTQVQVARMNRLASRTGMTLSEHVRRAVDAYLDLVEEGHKKARIRQEDPDAG